QLSESCCQVVTLVHSPNDNFKYLADLSNGEIMNVF
ncbi:MAG: hypothetical protein ACI9VT_002778, partial [Psychroserpens sp.]